MTVSTLNNRCHYEHAYVSAKDQEKILHAEIDDPSDFHLPGITQVIFAPLSIRDNFFKATAVYRTKDAEGAFDAALRLPRANFSFALGLGTIISFITPFIHTLSTIGVIIRLKNIALPILGIALSFFEALSEIQFIGRIYLFKKSLNTRPALSHKLKNLNKYLTLSTKEKASIRAFAAKKNLDVTLLKEKALHHKLRKLARRVRPGLAVKINRKLPQILSDLKSGHKATRHGALKDANRIVEQVDIQCKKRYLIHTIGLIAIAVTIIGLSLSMGGLPFIAVLPVILAGIGLTLLRSGLAAGYLDTRGWQFDHINLLPTYFQSHFRK